MAVVPNPALCQLCGSSGGSSGSEFEHNSVVLCDTLTDGTVVAAVILVQEYDEVTGLPVGSPVPTDPATGLPYVVQGTLQACSSEQAPVFAGFVCDSFGGSPMIPAVPPSCPGGPNAAPANPLVGAGLTEGPAGTFIVTGTTNPSYGFQADPDDAQHGLCAVHIDLNAANGSDPNFFAAWNGAGVDVNANSFSFDPTFIAAMEASMGVSSDTSIPSGTTGTATVGGTTVTMTVTGPSNNLCLSSNTGNFVAREGDGDGLASGFDLTFNPPVRSFNFSANLVPGNGDGILALTESQATAGTAAIPAQPAAIFEVKQFRNLDGTAFYENLDGTAHTVLGTIGECGDYFSELLCDAPTNTQFLRVYKISGGAIASFQDYDLAGGLYAVTGTAQSCEFNVTERDSEIEVLCWTETSTGNVTQFLRHYIYSQDGLTLVAVLDTLLDGTTPFVASTTGTVGVCTAGTGCSTESSIGTICYIPPPIVIPAQTLTDNWAGAAYVGPASVGAHTATNSNFGGAGITVIESGSLTGAVLQGGNAFQYGITTASSTGSIDLGAPRNNILIEIVDIDITESITGINPPATSVTAPGVLSSGGTQLNTTVDNVNVVLSFPNGTQVITFTANLATPASQFAQRQITFDTIASSTTQTQGTAAVIRDCETGVVSYVDLATGTAIDISMVTVVDCGTSSSTGPTADEIAAAYVATLPGIAADAFDVTPGTPWTPAAIPAGRTLTSLTFTVLSGTVDLVDATGATAISALPAGYTGTWSAADDRETLTPPASITAVAGRTVVLMTSAL